LLIATQLGKNPRLTKAITANRADRMFGKTRTVNATNTTKSARKNPKGVGEPEYSELVSVWVSVILNFSIHLLLCR